MGQLLIPLLTTGISMAVSGGQQADARRRQEEQAEQQRVEMERRRKAEQAAQIMNTPTIRPPNVGGFGAPMGRPQASPAPFSPAGPRMPTGGSLADILASIRKKSYEPQDDESWWMT